MWVSMIGPPAGSGQVCASSGLPAAPKSPAPRAEAPKAPNQSRRVKAPFLICEFCRFFIDDHPLKVGDVTKPLELKDGYHITRKCYRQSFMIDHCCKSESPRKWLASHWPPTRDGDNANPLLLKGIFGPAYRCAMIVREMTRCSPRKPTRGIVSYSVNLKLSH